MNCPSRTDEPLESDGWNQNPPGLAADLTTREDLNGLVNRRTQRDSDLRVGGEIAIDIPDPTSDSHAPRIAKSKDGMGKSNADVRAAPPTTLGTSLSPYMESEPAQPPSGTGFLGRFRNVGNVLTTFTKFIGPGFMVSVAYIDPGNYSTDVAAGAETKFKLLFIVLMSNVFAIILQSLAVRLGSVTGLNLAEHCRAHLPRWLNLFLYVLGEGAIIATDIAEVGSCPAVSAFCEYRLTSKLNQGDWLRDSSEPPPQNTAGGRMCCDLSRRSCHSDILQPGGFHETPQSFRAVCYGFSSRGGGVFLHRAFPAHKYFSWRGI